jgi:hypothetical protein
MPKLYIALITLGVLISTGCAQQAVRPTQGDDSSLQRWIQTELTPYMKEQLSGHPRFKGEPVIIVRLDGADIQPDIDGLTRSLRDRIMDSLLADATVRLPWQPQQQQAQHHRRLDQVQCGRIRDANYYVGIEITREATAQYRVSVRALDVRAGEWVSGFGKRWSGSLSSSELHALQERRSDESLRGLRVLPFSSDHPDLAATYLANNLSCLLRQQDEDDLVIYVESLKTDQSRLRILLSLIGNNLSRFREVRVTDTKQEANFLLRGEAFEVQSGMYQVWVVLHPKYSGEHLVGMDTATYVSMQPAGYHQRAQPARRVPAAKPAIAAMELVRRNSNSGGNSTCSVQKNGSLLAEDCPILELHTERADRVFVFVHGTRHGISRLSSGTCGNGSEAGLHTPSAQSYLFPSERFSRTDWPTIYAIAVSGAEPAQAFNRHIQILPDACGNTTGMRAGSDTAEQWLDTLDRLIADNGDHAVWAARRIP